MKDGAIEFPTKPFRDQDLLDAIHQGIRNDTWRRAEDDVNSDLRHRWLDFTAGEQDLMRLVFRGLLNEQIATALGVSEITVKVRRGQVMRKNAGWDTRRPDQDFGPTEGIAGASVAPAASSSLRCRGKEAYEILRSSNV
ncbi:LuxR C-terminal-related transcriptional regulator [Rhizobium calliandrae]|uniref:LuxR C-terminal-related transcriptional regulator n=1 Tax=Rhizobium calliandrae TaxID=1312182 RepID=A0ABT7KF19_9HYPH|nr:LuxR C-terminal-related transcriptional regulator [Rhizobium calliandrae]MDL2406593.1 LuxR C-terminal-related transcriptional regulator [Rhizobium calliandrae]